MKSVLTGFIALSVFSSAVFAEAVSQETINQVNEGLSGRNPQTGCEPEVYCRDLAEAVCHVGKQQRPLLQSAFHRFPKPPRIPARGGKPARDTVATVSWIRNIENDAFQNLPVTRENLNALYEETKTSLANVIRSQVQLPESTKAQMLSSLSRSSFMMGSQYLDERIESLARNNPGVPHEEIVNSAIDEYENFCQDGGLEINAFRRGTRLVFCPGLLYATADAGANNWEKMANALSFTMAHEIGHTISKDSFPDTYREMGNCYQQISGQREFWNLRGEETGADFWGVQIFSERLRSQNITNGSALEAIRHATVDFCVMSEDSTYPSGRNRINLSISRNSVMRTVLGCSGPTTEAPMCTLRGAYPSP